MRQVREGPGQLRWALPTTRLDGVRYIRKVSIRVHFPHFYLALGEVGCCLQSFRFEHRVGLRSSTVHPSYHYMQHPPICEGVRLNYMKR